MRFRIICQEAVAEAAGAEGEAVGVEVGQEAVEDERAGNDDVGAFGFKAGDLAALGEREMGEAIEGGGDIGMGERYAVQGVRLGFGLSQRDGGDVDGGSTDAGDKWGRVRRGERIEGGAGVLGGLVQFIDRRRVGVQETLGQADRPDV